MTDIAELPVTRAQAPSVERILRVSSVATFALFFQTYMIAPLNPFLSESLHTSRGKVGLLIPAYTLPYAAAALLCGTVSDRYGRKRILLLSVAGFVALSFVMAAAPSINALLQLRMISGALNVGIAVVSLSMVVGISSAAESAASEEPVGMFPARKPRPDWSARLSIRIGTRMGSARTRQLVCAR